MAKTTSKAAPKQSRKPGTRAPKAKSSPAEQIEKASVEAYNKLQSLGIDTGLQNDLEWCLGSYRADGNPVGLYDMVERAIAVFKGEQARKTKGVTSKLITDLEKAVRSKE